jgi:hypothetical protein
MKPYFDSLCSTLKLLLAAALPVLVSDLAGAEVASIYGGSDGLCGRPKEQADTVLEPLEGIPLGTLVEEIKRK